LIGLDLLVEHLMYFVLSSSNAAAQPPHMK